MQIMDLTLENLVLKNNKIELKRKCWDQTIVNNSAFFLIIIN